MACLDLARKRGRPRAGRYSWLQVSERLSDPEQHTSHALRRLLVQSLGDRRAARHQRARDLLRAHRKLWPIRGRLSRPAYRDRSLVERMVAQAVAKVARSLQVGVREGAQGPTVQWHLDREQVQEDELFDGIYSLLTTQTAAEASSQEVFQHYQG